MLRRSRPRARCLGGGRAGRARDLAALGNARDLRDPGARPVVALPGWGRAQRRQPGHRGGARAL